MSKITNALQEFETLSQKANENNFLTRIHPLAKLVCFLFYTAVTLSFSKYDLFGLISVAIFPIFIFIASDLSVKDAFFRLRFIIPIIILLGAFNPFLDRTGVFQIKEFTVTGGMVSFVTLVLKGMLTVFSSYIFIATTSIEKLCYALQVIHFPKVLITQLLLIYRYVTVLLMEVHKIMESYSLRAPNQKGIHFKVWGSLVGNLLLRSMDRAQNVYEAMCLRGFENNTCVLDEVKFRFVDFLILFFIVCGILALRFFPVLKMIGGLFL